MGKKDLDIVPISSSSKDYNQSVHRTINRNDSDQFWSSGSSEAPEASEWLTYKIPISSGTGENNKMLSGCAIINKFIIKVFDPKNLQNVPHKYAPSQVQIEVGSSPEQYDYKSKVFEVDQDSSEEQVFSITPDLCSGRYIKINLLGKPHIQPTDNKYYVALQYVGVQGIPFNELIINSNSNSQEESKNDN
jgi:hypothetical protein